MRSISRKLAALTAIALLGSLIGGVADAKSKKAGSIVVGTDAADDWGSAVDPNIGPIGDALGQELVEASIAKKDASTLDFIIKVNSLPAAGGMPEFTRYVWTIMVDGELIQLDGKFTNYSRGACDPTAGTCPPPRDPGQWPFLVRGECTDNGGNVVTCTEIGLINASADAASGTITIPVPLELIGAKVGSTITNGTQPGSAFSGIWAIPSAFMSQGAMPLDELIMTKAYKVPK